MATKKEGHGQVFSKKSSCTGMCVVIAKRFAEQKFDYEQIWSTAKQKKGYRNTSANYYDDHDKARST